MKGATTVISVQEDNPKSKNYCNLSDQGKGQILY